MFGGELFRAITTNHCKRLHRTNNAFPRSVSLPGCAGCQSPLVLPGVVAPAPERSFSSKADVAISRLCARIKGSESALRGWGGHSPGQNWMRGSSLKGLSLFPALPPSFRAGTPQQQRKSCQYLRQVRLAVHQLGCSAGTRCPALRVQDQPDGARIELSLGGFKAFWCCGQCPPSERPRAVALAVQAGGELRAQPLCPEQRVPGSCVAAALLLLQKCSAEQEPGAVSGYLPLGLPDALPGQRGASSLSKCSTSASSC